MTAAGAVCAAVALAGLLLGPALAGLVQWLKAVMQGRHGAGVLQPYRDLRKLWRRSVVSPDGTGPVYAHAPALVAAATALAVIAVPATSAAPRWPVLGADALLLVGLLALARVTLAMSAWDTSAAFGMMGAARDLAFAVAGEALLLSAILVASLPVGSTDLRALWAGAAGAEPWRSPAHWVLLPAMLLVVLVETGRQPIDNPDTHLELTMIHEGPLLEYAGRDLAMLVWAAGARHWVVVLLAAGIALPHPAGAWTGLLVTLAWVPVVCAVAALVETWVAKMRLVRAPRLIASGAALCLLALLSWSMGAGL